MDTGILKRFGRPAVQVGTIALFLFLLSKTTYPVDGRLPVGVYFRSDLYLAAATVIATGAGNAFFLPAAAMAAAMAVFGNFFCFRLCPVGAATDLLNRAILPLRRGRCPAVPPRLRKARFAVLGAALAGSCVSLVFPGFPWVAWAADPFVIAAGGILSLSGPSARFLPVALAAILVGGCLVPRLWCVCFCPLGAGCHLVGVKARGFLRGLARRGRASRG